MRLNSILSALSTFLLTNYCLNEALRLKPPRGEIDFDRLLVGKNGTTTINLGVILEMNKTELQDILKHGLQMQNVNLANSKLLDYEADIDIINTADAYKLSRLICTQFGSVYAVLGSVMSDSFETFHSYTNTFHVPFVTPWFPEKIFKLHSGTADYAISMTPSYHKAISDTIKYKEWKSIIYMYDSNDGLLRLAELYVYNKPGQAVFEIIHVRKITNASDTISYLRAIEAQDRWSVKNVVLDSNTELAHDVLKSHVRDPMLGRRNYNYFITSFILDERWPDDPELKSINITGFRVINEESVYVKSFRKSFAITFGRKSISARAALLVDALNVIIKTFIDFHDENPTAIRNTIHSIKDRGMKKLMECDMNKTAVKPFEHGETLMYTLKKLKIDGLTGPISFDKNGRRFNFTMNIVEMDEEGDFKTVARWSDLNGLALINKKSPPLSAAAKFNFKNKTYVVSSTLKAPFLVKSMDNGKESYKGFCKDLLEGISEKLDIKYKIRIAIDDKIGGRNLDEFGGWDGLMGEVVRKEVDMAIGPLEATSERETAVDFSKPFITPDFIQTKPSQIFNFKILMPFSNQILMCMGILYLVVSAVFYIISRISPDEWQIQPTVNNSSENEDAAPKIVLNHFNLTNTFWYTFSSLMRQYSGYTPRSLGGRILSIVWWAYGWSTIALYTASVTAFILLEYNSKITQTEMNDPINGLSINNARATATKHDNTDYWLDNLDDVWQTCDQMAIEPKEALREYVMAFPKGSELRAGINLGINAMAESGELQALTRKWFQKNFCDYKNGPPQITISQISGLFVIIFIGLAFAAVVTAIDNFMRRIKQNRQQPEEEQESAMELVELHERPPSRAMSLENVRIPAPIGWNDAPCAECYVPVILPQNVIPGGSQTIRPRGCMRRAGTVRRASFSMNPSPRVEFYQP